MIGKKPSVLIVDDEQVICDVLFDELSDQGYLCATAIDGNKALSKLAAQHFDAVLLDIRLPGMSGMEVLRKIWLDHASTVAIMITAINDVATAVEAMKLGAADYIVKPFDLAKVDASVRTALETKQVTSKSSTQMEAIARGAEATLDPLSGYAKLVTEKTVNVARQLGIAEKEIQEWAAAKAKLDSERNRVIKST